MLFQLSFQFAYQWAADSSRIPDRAQLTPIASISISICRHRHRQHRQGQPSCPGAEAIGQFVVVIWHLRSSALHCTALHVLNSFNRKNVKPQKS